MSVPEIDDFTVFEFSPFGLFRLLGSSDLSTMIGPGKGAASFDESGNALYTNRRTISSSDRTLINAFRTISGMCDRINLPRTITDRANT